MSNQPKNPTDSVIVPDDAVKSKTKLFKFDRMRSRKAAIVTLVIFVVAVVVVVLFVNNHSRSTQGKKTVQSAAQLLVNVNKGIATKNYQSAISAVNAAPSNKQNELLLVSIYQSQGNYKAALAQYQTVIKKYGSNYGLVSSAAVVAELAHDNAEAIIYYKQAEQYVSKQKPYATQKADEDFYETKIKALQAE